MVNYNNLEPVHILKMIVISGRGLKLFHGKSNIDKVAGKYIWQRAQKGSVITILRGQTFVKNIKTGNVSKFSLNTVYRYHSWLQYSQREREHSSLFKTLKFVFVTTMRRNIVYCVFEGFWWQFVQGLDIFLMRFIESVIEMLWN